MPNCYPNTLMITRPPTGRPCGPNCGVNNKFGDCPPGITPRVKRDAVIEEIKDYVLASLGAPVVDIELDDQQLDIAVKQTLKWVEYYAPREFFTYYTFSTVPGQSVYEMPPDVGYIRHVSYRETGEYAYQTSELGGAIPLEYFYPGGPIGGDGGAGGGFINPIQPIWGESSSWVIYKQYERMFTRLSSSLGGWEWIADGRHVKLYPIPFRSYKVIVHYMQRCKDWGEVHISMLDGALAHAKMMLGRIRSKFSSPPGPGGSIQLDGAQLVQEAKEELEKWREDLIYRFGDLGPITYG